MTLAFPIRKTAIAACLLAGTAMLSGCVLQPGTFEAEMNVRADGRFTFSYEGEIVAAGLGDLAAMADEAGASDDACTDAETGAQRPCTDAEIAAREQDEVMQREMVQGMLGGADMSDPETAAAFAASLERQAGWNRVEYTEEGVFEVSFAIDSQLGHDFDFPTIEGLPMNSPFVQARLRDERRVRIEAPGFVPQSGGNPLAAMVMGMAGAFGEAAGQPGEGEAPTAAARPTRGTFRLVTDAPILANNTDEGPQAVADGQLLVWEIDSSTSAAPMVLLDLD